MRWVQARRPKRCKTNAFLTILHVKGAPEAATTWIPKSKNSKINQKKWMFFANALGALWRPLWLAIFLSSHPQASRGPLRSDETLLNAMLFAVFRLDVHAKIWRQTDRKCQEVSKSNEICEDYVHFQISVETYLVPSWTGANLGWLILL